MTSANQILSEAVDVPGYGEAFTDPGPARIELTFRVPNSMVNHVNDEDFAANEILGEILYGCECDSMIMDQGDTEVTATKAHGVTKLTAKYSLDTDTLIASALRDTALRNHSPFLISATVTKL